MSKKFFSNPIIEKLIPWFLPILLIVCWFIFSNDGYLSKKILPLPQDVFFSFVDLLKSGQLVKHISISFQRALTGFLIGGGIGIILGLMNGLFPIAEKFLDTTIQMIRNIPHLAMIPIVVLWFGIGEESKIFLVALGVLFPVYVNTIHGIRSVDNGLIEMGKVYGLRSASLFWKVVLPGALPSILVGIRYALGIMWLTLIVSETIAANSGIGFLAMNAREFMQTDIIILSILLYALFGKLADFIAKQLEKHFLKWNPNYQK
ncbi:aliphatic sulfonate ABC transporter permease SsuC [Bacillus salipaludis]|uniref:aliphatic sulfonate ABC transporter permease SsuC n=1 Tax=Bacillus salipaludis TaxID=2547811 RepID=UPI002E1E72BE|nr:aliphatic sulfonate ABC transporter permease SsuC [Bacillus salipaludis]